MTHYDVFNGDADGLCALHQLRLAAPKAAVLISGVKRDIALVARLTDAHPGDSATVLDVALAANRSALVALLERGVRIEYFDHHFAGDALTHPNLDATLDASPDICTAMLVDRKLGGRQRIWAVVGAFGDNLGRAARALAAPLGLTERPLRELAELGETLAYNAYGDTEADLAIHPVALYQTLAAHADPFAFMAAEPLYARLRALRRDDLDLARLAAPEVALAGATVYVLPDEPWSRRARGLFANDLANRHPSLAHAVLTRNRQGGYTVSVRTPANKPMGADALCRKFATGGGRAAAAGINHLPPEALPQFVRELDAAFG